MTPAEFKCFSFIQAYMAANKGICPSYGEIAAGCNWSAKSHAHRVIQRLVRKGHIKREPYAIRTMEVVMGSPYSDIERAAIWWLLEARDGMTLPEIVKAVQDAYAKHDIDPGEPDEITPDSVTVWLAACWENFGFHVGLRGVA